MHKITLFLLVGNEKITKKHFKLLSNQNKSIKDHKKYMEITHSWHHVMLSKYFNLYNFYEYQDKILEFSDALIYHTPYGKDDNVEDVESKLLNFKGKVPIVMRNYDAHSSFKLSKNYMLKYHDLCLSYLSAYINNKNILFAQISYDNFLVSKYNNIPKNRKFACIILRQELRQAYFEDSNNFKTIGLDLQKTYDIRQIFVNYNNIDVYGANWPLDMKNYKGVLIYERKHLVQNQYKFNFILENAIVDNYLSEKILDTFLSLSVPVYLGSPVIDKYIPKECFIDIRDFKNNDELIKYLEYMSDKEYNNYIDNILKYRNDIFNKFSTKNNFAKIVYQWYKSHINDNVEYEDIFLDKEDNKILSFNYKNPISFDNILSDLKQKVNLFWYQKVIK